VIQNLERRRQKGRESYKRHRQKRLKYAKDFRLANPTKMIEDRLIRKYGITLKQHENIMTEQNNECACCIRPFSSDLKPAVDHCHKTGKVRGLLCSNCNRAIGLLYDKAEAMLRLAIYLTVT
jgi:hypothetical protein